MSDYIWPFPQGTPISQPFGSNPSNGFNPAGGHTGTDFAVPTGTPVRAIAAGNVKGVGQLPEPYTSNPWWIEGQWAGNVVVIDHGPVVSVYAHLSEWHVNLGDTVSQGQVIGLSGASGGASTGPHCHFETIPDGWDFNNGTYGRVEPGTYCTAYWDGNAVTPQSITEDPMPTPEELWNYPITINGKPFAASDVLRYADTNAAAANTAAQQALTAVNGLLATRLPAPDGSGKSYTLAEYITYGWLYGMNAGPRVLGQPFKLADGSTARLTEVLDSIKNQPASPGAAGAPFDVEAFIARIKAELPPAIRADIAAKLTN